MPMSENILAVGKYFLACSSWLLIFICMSKIALSIAKIAKQKRVGHDIGNCKNIEHIFLDTFTCSLKNDNFANVKKLAYILILINFYMQNFLVARCKLSD